MRRPVKRRANGAAATPTPPTWHARWPHACSTRGPRERGATSGWRAPTTRRSPLASSSSSSSRAASWHGWPQHATRRRLQHRRPWQRCQRRRLQHRRRWQPLLLPLLLLLWRRLHAAGWPHGWRLQHRWRRHERPRRLLLLVLLLLLLLLLHHETVLLAHAAVLLALLHRHA
jgi:hypothetical protein